MEVDVDCNYAFGKMFLIGSQPPFKVKGLWLFHGQEISRFIIDDYEWKKVDISDKAQEMLVNQIIEGIQLFEGEPVLYDKFFN
ncbi:elongation factor 1-gamma-like [Trifolium medium]|uniref:Elongation factor 1-gamma-like n=1 Tax=Trifolium medium TaxID=97028 RepID=A0A392P9A1_9FABA|nr:elongation factor 1-gamma-like [Trifolium medium]